MPQPDEALAQLEEVDEALARYAPTLDAALDTVLDQAVSDYPVLVWQRGAVAELGVKLLDDAQPGAWEVRVTTLEELAGRRLLLPERVEGFRQVYKDARAQYCLFVISPLGARFAFRPRG